MNDWHTDAERAADEGERPKVLAEAWFIGILTLASVAAVLWGLLR